LVRRRETGEATARQSLGRPGTKLAGHEAALLARLREHPDAKLAELRGWLAAERGVSVALGTLWNALDRLGWTLKKSRSAQRSRTDRTSPRRGRLGARLSPA
jgi:transposase